MKPAPRQQATGSRQQVEGESQIAAFAAFVRDGLSRLSRRFSRHLACCLLPAACCLLPSSAFAQAGAEVVQILRQGAKLFLLNGQTEDNPEKKASDNEPLMVLRWNNGETLPGQLAGATADELDWQAAWFNGPLRLGWPALHRIDRKFGPKAATSAPQDSFHFVLRDGSHLYGRLTGLTADAVTLQSTRHGDLVLKRAEVLSARRIRGGSVVYDGPLGESGWEAVAAANRRNYDDDTPNPTLNNVPVWTTGPGGALVLPYPRRTARLKLSLPDRLDVEFRLHGKEQPAFRLAVAGGEKDRLRVETWGDELVLAAGDQYVSLRKLPASDRDVALRLRWDRPAHRCEVYDPSGALLKTWTVPEEPGDKTADIRLENKGHELTLDTLRVRRWDGETPVPSVDLHSPCVELADGRTLPGPVGVVTDGEMTLPSAGEGPAARFALADVDGLVFSGDAPAAESNQTRLTFTDGTLLLGPFTGFRDGRATLQNPAVAAGSLTTGTDALRQVFVHVPTPAGLPPEPALKTLDKLVGPDGSKLHGHLVTDGAPLPRWQTVGSVAPAALAQTFTGEIQRTVDPAQIPMGVTSLFYTRWGDVLPGTLHGMTRTNLEFDSRVAEVKSLPNTEWTAVQFNVSTGGAVTGFDAPGWRFTGGNKAAPPPKSNEITLKQDEVLAHPVAAQNGEIKFTFGDSSFCTLRLRLFGDGATPNSKGLSYLVSRNGNQFSTARELEEGEEGEQATTTYTQSGDVTVRLAIDDKGVRCYLNNALADVLSYPVTKRTGTGLTLQAVSQWGNSIRDVPLAKFSATLEPGQGNFQEVNADAKVQALTVPRFRKEDPPHHALLAANGDILRGEIEAVTNTQLGFRVGLETLKVPRERVAAVVALQKPLPPAASPAKPPEADDIKLLLAKPVNEQGSYWGSSLSNLVSVVKQSAPGLKVKLPANAGSVRMRYRFTPRTVGETLENLCEQFGMNYRIEDGQVVIESEPSKAGPALAQTVYWLKTNTLAEKGSVAETLAAKGVKFPAGAGAEFLGGPLQLQVTDTAENQEKVARLLADEFGGVMGSPTHWLRLNNGGRLGLAVERFDQDAVVGTHPVYGRCRVPMADVYAIRNTPPDLAAANRTVGTWQLVYAPEPVLPESGGDGSTLLGKEAPAFKLPMLAGGDDFELGKERGHVVVLDFWATWCGPCIRSLPGLMETVAQFPADKVRLVGVNQAEGPEQVKRFLKTRGWDLAVALDAGQKVGSQYGADSIPLTVIVGPDGKVAWVKNGYSEDGDEQVAAAIKKLLAPPEPAGKTAALKAAGHNREASLLSVGARD